MQSRFGGDTSEVVPVRKVHLPSLEKIIHVVPRDDNFSIYMPNHRKVASNLIDIFLSKYTSVITNEIQHII